MDVASWILSKKYTDQSIEGISGVLAGKNCTISDVSKTGLVTTITFQWTADNGDTRTTQIQVNDGETPSISVTPTSDGHTVTFETSAQTETFDVKDGISVSNVTINSAKHLIITLSNGSTIDAGKIETVTELSELTDVELANLADKEVLTYDATSGKWVNKELDIAVNIVDLKDVDTTNLVDGSILKYNSTTGKFTSVLEALNDISDVTVTTPQNKQVLKYNGSHWVNSDNKVVDLADVQIINPVAGQILVYDPVAKKWVNDSPSSTTTKLDDLADVDITQLTLEDKQILVYDAENQVWVNADNTMTVESLDAIQDVDIQNIQDGQIIVWDNNLQKWVNANVATKLRDLTDVSLGTLADLDLIRYSLTRQRWENYSADNVVTENSVNVVTSGAVFTAIKNTVDKIGDLTTLKTTDKTTIVNALNEVYDALVDLTDKVGDIATLTTTDKTSVVNAINELVTKVNAMKYLEQVTTMPTSSEYPNRVLQYIGSDTADYKRGYIYRSTPSIIEGEIVYSWERLDVQPTNNNYNDLINKPQINSVELAGDKSLDDLGINGKFQYAVLPTADNTLVGKIVEYTGGNTASLKTGYFYRCQYVSENDDYEWIQLDVSSNAELAQRIAQLETNQGDMSALTIPSVSDLVSAINVLAIRGIKSITYSEPYLSIVLQDDSSFQFDITVILQSTDLGDLGNVLDATIQNGNLLQYDSAILKYKPYNVATVLSNLLQSAKDYTDQEILKVNTASAIVVDSKPTYDASTDTVVYYKDGQVHVTDKPETRFYYTTVDGSFCVSWIDGTEFLYNVAQVDYDDFVSKTNDVVSTYTTTMVDKSKIPDISALDALYTIIANALALKTNISDIVDNLLSDDATVPLSAKQGKVLNLKFNDKQNIIQYTTMVQVTPQMVTDNVVVQYIGADSQAYLKGRWYEASYNSEQDIYYWKEIKYSPDMVEITATEVDNLWA